MRDAVADVLAQRAALDRGAGTAVALSLLLHGGITALAVYAALHATAPAPATMVNIQFARVAPVSDRPSSPPKPAQSAALSEPKIAEPKPVVEKTPPKAPEKNTVPLSPFGRSTKKGSEVPAATPPSAPPSTGTVGGTSTAPEVPIGGSGVTGLEGGDFPYTLYIEGMHRRIGANWFRPQVAAGASASIYFRIQRDGTISEARVETSSGNGTFDRAALSAVRSASPLNPLPFGYSGNYLGVHLTFR